MPVSRVMKQRGISMETPGFKVPIIVSDIPHQAMELFDSKLKIYKYPYIWARDIPKTLRQYHKLSYSECLHALQCRTIILKFVVQCITWQVCRITCDNHGTSQGRSCQSHYYKKTICS
ncbi:hypothetical protein ALC53_04066 [Atta colombica]|uniref:Uncharacterized protein n=1 Tax=Atta colombica TaxID=520822 RepID=A0A195BLP2_9HYME|nr:hypothetical protein ALC53_04066 [Atta colombica]